MQKLAALEETQLLLSDFVVAAFELPIHRYFDLTVLEGPLTSDDRPISGPCS